MAEEKGNGDGVENPPVASPHPTFEHQRKNRDGLQVFCVSHR
jgi:hypothetical protein